MFVSEGKMAAMPGRSIPGSVRNLIVVAATAAPVWPALTIAAASPFFTRSTARLTDESFLRLTDSTAPSVISTTWVECTISTRRSLHLCFFSSASICAGVADEEEFVDLWIFAQRHDCTADEVRRPEIAAHGVQSDLHRGANLRFSAIECKTKIGEGKS